MANATKNRKLEMKNDLIIYYLLCKAHISYNLAARTLVGASSPSSDFNIYWTFLSVYCRAYARALEPQQFLSLSPPPFLLTTRAGMRSVPTSKVIRINAQVAPVAHMTQIKIHIRHPMWFCSREKSEENIVSSFFVPSIVDVPLVAIECIRVVVWHVVYIVCNLKSASIITTGATANQKN